jgi:S-disulfanyl-L-cysteine oxidoreductase SoxD
MFTDKRLTVAMLVALCLGGAAAVRAADLPGLGKPISEAELALWDISIGPGGRSLPPGAGTAPARRRHICAEV